MDLQGTSTPKGKLFIVDARGDGLQAGVSGGAWDVASDDGTRGTSFDDDWKNQKLSRDEYLGRFVEVDRHSRAHAGGGVSRLRQEATLPWSPPGCGN